MPKDVLRIGDVITVFDLRPCEVRVTSQTRYLGKRKKDPRSKSTKLIGTIARYSQYTVTFYHQFSNSLPMSCPDSLDFPNWLDVSCWLRKVRAKPFSSHRAFRSPASAVPTGRDLPSLNLAQSFAAHISDWIEKCIANVQNYLNQKMKQIFILEAHLDPPAAAWADLCTASAAPTCHTGASFLGLHLSPSERRYKTGNSVALLGSRPR